MALLVYALDIKAFELIAFLCFVFILEVSFFLQMNLAIMSATSPFSSFLLFESCLKGLMDVQGMGKGPMLNGLTSMEVHNQGIVPLS